MSVIGVNEAGVEALKKYAADLDEGTGSIRRDTDQLGDIVDQHQGKLGPHASQIKNALEQIKGATFKGVSSAKTISEKLERLASAYQKVIDGNYYGGTGN